MVGRLRPPRDSVLKRSRVAAAIAQPLSDSSNAAPYKTRSRRTKTALFVGKPRYRQSRPMKLLATPRGAHNDHAEDDERNAKASLSNADSIDLHRLTSWRLIRSS